MPQGAHHFTPPGLWYQTPKTSTIPRLLLGSFSQLLMGVAVYFGIVEFRKLQYTYTYKNFIGRTMSFGNVTTLTHEPLSTAEIDKLFEEQEARKRRTRQKSMY